MQYTYYFDISELNGDDIKPGDHVLVYSRLDILGGGESFHISKQFAASGYPGNLDPSVKCFHGWRGTTNNIAVYAHGVYTVKSVSVEAKEWHFKVVLNRNDIKKREK